MKRIDIKEFRGFGYLQEANRQFFHPLGLALEVIIDEETGEETLGGVWDARDDPEGFLFVDQELNPLKAERVKEMYDAKAKVRQETYKYVVQPIPEITT